MNNELEKIYIEGSGCRLSKVVGYPPICLEGLKENTKTSVGIASLRAEIRNQDPQNTKLTTGLQRSL
jgi:hypothetical protein